MTVVEQVAEHLVSLPPFRHPDIGAVTLIFSILPALDLFAREGEMVLFAKKLVGRSEEFSALDRCLGELDRGESAALELVPQPQWFPGS